MVKVASWRDSRKTVKVPDPPEKLPPPYRLCAMEIDDVSPAASLRPSKALEYPGVRSARQTRDRRHAARNSELTAPRTARGSSRHALPCATSSLSSSSDGRTVLSSGPHKGDSVNFSQYTNPVRDESLIHALYTDLTHSLSQPKPSLVVYLTKPSRVCCPPSPHRSADPPL